MKITLTADAIRSGMAKSKPSRRPALAVLNSAKVIRKNGHITLYSTDLDDHNMTLIREDFAEPTTDLGRRLLSARFERENGEFLVPFTELATASKTATGPISLISTADTPGDITHYRTRITYDADGVLFDQTFDSIPPGEYPDAPDISDCQWYHLPDNAVIALQRSFDNASEDVTRSVLMGAYATSDAIIGTDGRSLVRSFVGITVPRPVIIPPSRLIKSKISLNYAVWENAETQTAWAAFNEGNFVSATKEIEGNFPNYKQVIPDDASFKVVGEIPDAAGLLSKLKMVPKADRGKTFMAVAVSDSSLDFSFDGGRFAIPYKTTRRIGKPIKIGFGVDLLSRPLRWGMREISFIDSQSPIRLRDPLSEFIMMPTRAPEEVTEPA
jgi:hypothetical protein